MCTVRISIGLLYDIIYRATTCIDLLRLKEARLGSGDCKTYFVLASLVASSTFRVVIASDAGIIERSSFAYAAAVPAA
jgi:hypothetical protein